MKVGARVMLTFNIDTCDSLTNGTFGEVLGFEFDNIGGISKVIVNFDNKESGQERRQNFVELQRKYDGKFATPIEKIEFNYSLSKKPTSASTNATATQIPLRLAFAATSHKVQGSTIKKPNSLVVDLRSVREAAQAYVMLSRIQALSQLIILVSVCANKIYSSAQAVNELERLKQVASQHKQIKRGIVSCNIRSLKKHFSDLKVSSRLEVADAICLQETWLNQEDESSFEIEGMAMHLNSVGAGKGIATYFSEMYEFVMDVRQDKYQMTQIRGDTQDIINV